MEPVTGVKAGAAVADPRRLAPLDGRFFAAFPAFLAGLRLAEDFLAAFLVLFLAALAVVFFAAFLALFFAALPPRLLAADFLAEPLPARLREPFDVLLDFFAGITLVSF